MLLLHVRFDSDLVLIVLSLIMLVLIGLPSHWISIDNVNNIILIMQIPTLTKMQYWRELGPC